VNSECIWEEEEFDSSDLPAETRHAIADLLTAWIETSKNKEVGALSYHIVAHFELYEE
jgi:hypothetical protein